MSTIIDWPENGAFIFFLALRKMSLLRHLFGRCLASYQATDEVVQVHVPHQDIDECHAGTETQSLRPERICCDSPSAPRTNGLTAFSAAGIAIHLAEASGRA